MTTPQTWPHIPAYTVTAKLYESARIGVYRAIDQAEQRPVVIKLMQQAYPTVADLVQFRNQFTIGAPLDHPGIVKMLNLETQGNAYALIIEERPGLSLAAFLRSPVTVAAGLQIALQLTDILHYLCQHRVIHKDIKPDNILIEPQSLQVTLLDFSIASLLPRETPEIVNPKVLEGTLPYMAPEQTGRMNRGIDFRTDFYGLGVTLFEVFAGQRPFQAEEPMAWVHCHIAQPPPSLSDFGVPVAIAAIVDKLLAKNAEDRYQTALGLKHDLETCWTQWQNQGDIACFELGQRDSCDRFLIPEKLYGRQVEVQTLLAAFERVAGRHGPDPSGGRELLVIAGHSGVGKTAVVNEIHKPIVRQRGWFIQGKYDRFQRNIPFQAIAQAFRQLMDQLLSEAEPQLQQWRTLILEAVGNAGQVIIDVIPELEQIIGPQPMVPALSGAAAQNRFNLLFQRFLRVFTAPEHPLAIFLDELQWADAASLCLLQRLLEDEVGSLLVIGAYRDNEVLAAHPLMQTLEAITQTATPVTTLTLPPLDQSALNQLVADTLQCSVVVAEPLAQLVHHHTQGNPFFVSQFLQGLQTEGLIQFNPVEGGWQADLAAVRAAMLTDDVVAFVADQLRKLPAASQTVLKYAACMGNSFDLRSLAIVLETSQEQLAQTLWPLLQAGLIVPRSDVYKFFMSHTPPPAVMAPATAATYQFLHDRVHQAAYSLIAEAQRPATHLKIGELLLQQRSQHEPDVQLLTVVNQLNLGCCGIERPQRCRDIAQLNLEASRKAKAATAYAVAAEYGQRGIQLLTETGWSEHYALMLALHHITVEALSLAGDFATMEQLAQETLDHAQRVVDQVEIYDVQIQTYMRQLQLNRCIEVGLEALGQLGVHLPPHPNQQDIQAVWQALQDQLAARPVASLVALTENQDANMQAALRLISSLSAPAYCANMPLYRMAVLTQARLCVQHGQTPNTPHAFAGAALVLTSAFNELELGYQLGQLAATMAVTQPHSSLNVRTMAVFYGHIQMWQEPLRATRVPLAQAFQLGVEVGDFEYAGYCAAMTCYHGLLAGMPLAQVEQQMQMYHQVLTHQIRNDQAQWWQSIYYQTVLNLMGQTDCPWQLVGPIVDEEAAIPILEQTGNRMLLHMIHANRMMLHYLFGRYEDAIAMGLLAEMDLDSVAATPAVPTFYLYYALALLASARALTALEQAQILEQVAPYLQKMRLLAAFAPMNFQHKAQLLAAECHRLKGNRLDAIKQYDLAIAGAQVTGYLQEEALANELAAQFYLDWGLEVVQRLAQSPPSPHENEIGLPANSKERVATAYLQEAYYCYARWGAEAKTQALEQRYPRLLKPILQQPMPPFDPLGTLATVTRALSHSQQPSLGDQLDLAAVLRFAQMLSSRIQLEELIGQLLAISIQLSGAEQGAVILPDDQDQWQVYQLEHPQVLSSNTPPILQRPSPLAQQTQLPVHLIHQVSRTHIAVVWDQAHSQPAQTLADPYLNDHPPQSLLCLPLLYSLDLKGLLYLENRCTTAVFTPERTTILEFLGRQAAIALSNAQTNHRLTATNAELLRATRLKDDFLAMMNHELRTPLNAILGMTEGLQEAVFGELSDAQLKALQTVEHSGTHLLGLINDILDLSKLEAGHIELECQPVAVTPLCNASLAFIQQQAQKKHIQVHTQCPPDLPDLIVDERRIRQVLINLLNNAVKFTPAGGQITLNIQPVSPENPSSERSFLRITVRDTGIGIAPDNLQKLFQPFIQVDSNLNRKYEGTGLGLVLVKRIIEQHGGQVVVTSEVGVGSCFAIDLPCQPLSTAPAQAVSKRLTSVAPSAPPPQEPPLILMAEDNETNVVTISSYLEAKGYRMLVAQNGQEAISLLESTQPDLVLMDIQMPVMDGFEAIQRIRHEPTLAGLPIIALTALAQHGDRERCLEAGANDYLSKPVKLKQLASTIQDLLVAA